ncbi:Uncharacterised protein [Staphylococcus aureus]|uniref:Uncharacterized protein n=1 Tax=Staphylococcus aureus TaxID=1280 RepID=A0A380EHT2_STAAU|nr:Uncharacterised protein [Staphylococcus aureus]
MSNTDKYLRDIARELKGIRKELQSETKQLLLMQT